MLKTYNMKNITSVVISPKTDQATTIRDIIQNEGAVILRNLIDKNEAARLKEALLSALNEDKVRYGEGYVFYGMVHALMNRGQAFLDLLSNKELLSIFRAILGHGCIIHAYNSSSMPGSKTNFSRTIHVDTPRLIENYITNMGLTIALDPFTAENGAMEIIPSSFNLRTPPGEDQFERDKIALDDLNVGDAILFNARCWHRGGINKTNNWRHAVTMNVCRAYMRQQFDYSTMLGEDRMKSLPTDVQQFLGYFVRMPGSMEEFLLPAAERKYRSGQE